MFTRLDYSSALEYSIIRRYTNIVYYYYHVVPICYAKHNAHNTIHIIVNLFMSKVYNESCFKRNQCVSHLFLWICIIHYAQLYKSSHALFYDLVMTIAHGQLILYTCYLSNNFANRNDMLPVWYK